MSAHGKNTKDSIGQRTSSKSTSMNVEESKLTSDKQFSQSYTNASDATVGLPLALEDKLKKSLPGFGIEQSVNAFFVHSLYGTTLPNHFEVSKDELVMMASIVDEKILDMGRKEGKILKTSDGQSVTVDELLGWRKQGGRSPEVMKMLYDKQIELEEKDVELKQLKADLEEKRRLAEEQAIITSSIKAKLEELKKTNRELEEEIMCIHEMNQGVHSPNVQKKRKDRQQEREEKDKELKAKDEQFTKAIAEFRRELEENAKIIQTKDKIIDESNKKVEELKKEIDKLKNKNEKLDKEIKHVCEKYDSEKNMFATDTRNLKSVINDKTKMIQQFEMEMETYHLDYNELQKKLKASEERFELQTENFKQYINELQEKLKASDKKCQNLSSQVKSEQKTNEFMKAEHEDEIRKINSKIKDLLAERDDLKHRYDSEKNMFATDTRNLKSVINDKTKMIQQFEMEMETYHLDYNELQKKLKASEERFELQTENFKQYINELQEKLKASDKKCQNLSSQVKSEQKTNEFMKAEHEDEIRKINSKTCLKL